MEWNVYVYDFNNRKVKAHNVFNNTRFLRDCKNALKKYKEDKEKFSEYIKKSLMCSYWSKCEWEIIISSWPPHPEWPDEKVDVFAQVMLNWNVFIDYLWEHQAELKKMLRGIKEK